MPTQPTADGRNSRERRQAWALSAGDVVLLGGLFNVIYSTLVIHALARPDSRLGVWVGTWIQIARKTLEPAYVLAGGPGCGGAEPGVFVTRAWTFDVHLVVINLIVAAAVFLASRPLWMDWARQLYAGPRRRNGTQDARRAAVEAGFGAIIWGAVAVVWLMVLNNGLFDSAAHCASLQPWFLFREPLLTTAAHGLASVAAVLWVARKS